jgi:hypothetical protein
MDASDGLAKNGHDYGMCGIGSGELHVRRYAVGRNALQHELAGVGILAFVAFEGNREKVDANESCGEEYECQGDVCDGKVAHESLSDWAGGSGSFCSYHSLRVLLAGGSAPCFRAWKRVKSFQSFRTGRTSKVGVAVTRNREASRPGRECSVWKISGNLY